MPRSDMVVTLVDHHLRIVVQIEYAYSMLAPKCQIVILVGSNIPSCCSKLRSGLDQLRHPPAGNPQRGSVGWIFEAKHLVLEKEMARRDEER